MKLNKVLALALSGVMAVSMLAGCSNNSGNGGQEGEEQTPATIQVAADINDAMTDDNQKKIVFTDDGELQNQLATAVALNGIVTLPSGAKVETTMKDLTGIDGDYNTMTTNNLNKSYEVVLVRKYGSSSMKLEAAVKNFVNVELNTWIAAMPENNLIAGQKVEDLAEGQTYVAYSYTGSVAVVEAPNADETNSAYYFAVVISQNSTVMTKTAD